MSIRFSISLAPSEPMTPRRWDERVGYFNTVFRDLGDHRSGVGGMRGSDLIDSKVRR